MPGSLTTPGRPALAMTRSDVLPSTICTVSAPKIGLFRGSMAGLCAPLSTLRRDPRGPLRMTWGRCGSLLLHRKGLSPSTPCRSPGASHMSSGFAPRADIVAACRHVRFVSKPAVSNRSKQRSYSITSSARASSVGGNVMPRTLAVIRLMISSTFTACWTGRSAGLSPLRMRPT